MTAPHLVLGLGNELFTDEGIGVVVSRRFADLAIPGIDVVDGGTLGIALLPTVAGRRSILIFDAIVATDAQPGEIIVLESSEVRQGSRIMYSAHQLGISEVLVAAQLAGGPEPNVAAVGLVPYSLETGYGVTVDAQNRIPAMLEQGMEILAAWGALEVAADA
ncbi:MAG: hydrogenase maturation protease [Actinomycetia bacterium]|nr:hydrogenase maturation protease [Actinomycetes bacterium]